MRLFQIGYGDKLVWERAILLRRHGYQVTSVIGNDAARAILGSWPDYQLFIIGHRAAEPVRLDMIQWLSLHHPGKPVVALNPLGCHQLGTLQFNATFDDPAVWVPLIATATQAPSRLPLR